MDLLVPIVTVKCRQPEFLIASLAHYTCPKPGNQSVQEMTLVLKLGGQRQWRQEGSRGKGERNGVRSSEAMQGKGKYQWLKLRTIIEYDEERAGFSVGMLRTWPSQWTRGRNKF